MARSRNPKRAAMNLSLTEAMLGRLDALADLAGANRNSMAGICLAFGVNWLEVSFQAANGVSQARLMADLREAGLGESLQPLLKTTSAK